MPNRSGTLLFALLACDGSKDTSPEDTADTPDAPVDGDADTDADADGDTDADTDTDTTIEACSDGVLAGVLPLVVSGTTEGSVDDWQASCTNGNAEEVALQFVAPSSGRFGFDTAGSSFDTVLYVLADCGGTELSCNDDASGTTSSKAYADLSAGESALVVVDGFQQSGAFQLTVTEVPALEQDCGDGGDEDYDGMADCLDPDCEQIGDCAARCPDLVLGSPPAVVVDSTTGQVDESVGSCDTYGGSASDVSVEFTAPAQGQYAFLLTDETEFDSVLYVLDACGGNELGCSDAYPVGYSTDGGGELVLLDLAANQTVIAVVDGFAGANGSFELFILEVAAAESDCGDAFDEDFDGQYDCLDPDCAGAADCQPLCPDQVLGAPPSVLQDTTLGRIDEWQSYCDGYGVSSSDVFVQFTAPTTDSYVFHLTPQTEYDSLLSVLSACGGEELVCSDVYGFGTGGGEAVVVDLTAGETVVAVVDGYAGSSGDFELLVDYAPPEICGTDLDEDYDFLYDCLDPDCLSDPSCVEVCPEGTLSGALPIQVLGENLGAADDFTGSCAQTGFSASDTTYTFTAPAAATYTFDTVGSYTDTLLVVLDGSCTGAELACNDDIDLAGGIYQSEVQVTLSAGQTVIVVVDGYSEYAGGDFVLNVQ
jgi:hypothetical protein